MPWLELVSDGPKNTSLWSVGAPPIFLCRIHFWSPFGPKRKSPPYLRMAVFKKLLESPDKKNYSYFLKISFDALKHEKSKSTCKNKKNELLVTLPPSIVQKLYIKITFPPFFQQKRPFLNEKVLSINWSAFSKEFQLQKLKVYEKTKKKSYCWYMVEGDGNKAYYLKNQAQG